MSDTLVALWVFAILFRTWSTIAIEASLLAGSYEPMPARRKEIEKPDEGIRLLGIPTVLDRLIQQAIAQVLEKVWDHTFSESSYPDLSGPKTQLR